MDRAHGWLCPWIGAHGWLCPSAKRPWPMCINQSVALTCCSARDARGCADWADIDTQDATATRRFRDMVDSDTSEHMSEHMSGRSGQPLRRCAEHMSDRSGQPLKRSSAARSCQGLWRVARCDLHHQSTTLPRHPTVARGRSISNRRSSVLCFSRFTSRHQIRIRQSCASRVSLVGIRSGLRHRLLFAVRSSLFKIGMLAMRTRRVYNAALSADITSSRSASINMHIDSCKKQ